MLTKDVASFEQLSPGQHKVLLICIFGLIILVRKLGILQKLLLYPRFILNVINIIETVVHKRNNLHLKCFPGFMQGEENLGPVVQSIVSFTSSLRGHLVQCFRTL